MTLLSVTNFQLLLTFGVLAVELLSTLSSTFLSSKSKGKWEYEEEICFFPVFGKFFVRSCHFWIKFSSHRSKMLVLNNVMCMYSIKLYAFVPYIMTVARVVYGSDNMIWSLCH